MRAQRPRNVNIKLVPASAGMKGACADGVTAWVPASAGMTGTRRDDGNGNHPQSSTRIPRRRR